MDRTIEISRFPNVDLFSEDKNFAMETKVENEADGVYLIHFNIKANEAKPPQPMHLRWKLPALNAKGVWRCGSTHDKRLRYDWELDHHRSRISVDAPVLCVFGHSDENLVTFACSDAINLIEMNALLREEDCFLYCHLTFFNEPHPAIEQYEATVRVDVRNIQFSKSIKAASNWWTGFEHLKPSVVPAIAKTPLYSTWYNYHQNLEETSLVEECKMAKKLGFDLIIIDDGWQTMDTNRGYNYTGDWLPERFPQMADFVEKIHQTGMKLGLWFSVPFCGKESSAYKKFKGKFLTENHRWAPVFDPRYPVVRQYLIEIYTKAVALWNIDALKLDFIDDFKVYDETNLTKANGRDYANVNEAVDRLLKDTTQAIKKIKPGLGIEFRQRYIGPALRKYGNMFRAFDCPNDPVSNRIRITDVKLLCGKTAVHSDMIIWHKDEKVEAAALQLVNAIFGVPQISVLLNKISSQHSKMIKHFTEYWKTNANILMDGQFEAYAPLSNYTYLKSTNKQKAIYAVYEDVLIEIEAATATIDVLNGKMSERILIKTNEKWQLNILNCFGETVDKKQLNNQQDVHYIEVPVSGLIEMKKL